MNINIYCGWKRDAIIKEKPNIVSDIAFQITCIECQGTGQWSFGPPGTNGTCIDCKGTGKQYVGL
jgi:DnaJ-class molecular chaperone